MKLKYLLVPATALSLALSGSALAKKPEGKGNPHQGGPDARWENSNRQSDESSLRGRERAEERHRMQEHKKGKGKKYKHDKEEYYDLKGHDKKKGKHDRYERDRDDGKKTQKKNKGKRYKQDKEEHYDLEGHDKKREKHDRYERQRHKEKYRNNPVDKINDQNVNDEKSKGDSIHRKTKESNSNKNRELTGDDRRKERANTSKPWWSIFEGE